jgi:hypothetical protein
MALGPAGLNVLSESVTSYLDPVLSVALATLGVFAGLDVTFRIRRERTLLLAASLESGLTILAVWAGLVALQWRFELFPPLLWQILVLFGVSAAVSSSASDEPDEPASLAARVGDLDDVLPIVLGALVIASIHAGPSIRAVSLVLQSGAIAVIIAVAGWLLVAQASEQGEQNVFTAGTLLLLGGAAAYVSMSPLWLGFCGGIVWRFVGGPARASIDRDMRYLQHPLVVLLLLVAGARLRLTPAVLGIAAVYIVCRAGAKLAGGWLASHLVLPELPADLGRRLIAPGVIAVASALNVYQIVGSTDAANVLLAVAVVGALGSELLAVIATARRLP